MCEGTEVVRGTRDGEAREDKRHSWGKGCEVHVQPAGAIYVSLTWQSEVPQPR
jgi:hypothetical protein